MLSKHVSIAILLWACTGHQSWPQLLGSEPPAAPEVASSEPATADALPSLSHLTKEPINLGSVKPGSTVSYLLSIPNRTSRTLRIYGYYRSCGCTELRFRNTVAKPGEPFLIDTSVKAPSHEASSGFVIKVQTSYDDRALVQFEDRFEFTFHSRPDCSFQPHNPRLEVGPTGGAPLIVRAVNYSSEPWLKPMAMLDDAGIPVSFRDITANINGVQRQVLLVTFDRKALSDVFGQRRSVPQKVQLSIYDTRTDFLAKKVGTLAIPVVFAKIFDLHPASVFWTPGQSKPVTLIAVCRSCPDDLSADDFEVTLGETPLKNVEIEALKGGWSRLRVVIPAALSELNGDPSIVVRVPRLGYAGTTAVRIAEPK